MRRERRCLCAKGFWLSLGDDKRLVRAIERKRAMTGQPVCKGCGNAIQGVYVTALGADWHPEHFLCAACRRPIGEASFYQHHGQPYHTECYRREVAPRCAYCNKSLIGQYLVDHWGTKFCPEHQGQFPTCRFCGRLVPPHHQGSDSQTKEVCCPVCRANAIEYIAQARPIFARLVQWVNGQGLMYNNLNLRIELCSRRQLAQLLRKPSDTRSLGATLYTTYTQDGRVVRTEVNGVAILRGLPVTLFQGVTVHELGHAWLIVHGVTDLPRWAEEGFCELLAHRLYDQMNTPESRYHAMCIERQNDAVYGEGFRRVRALMEAVGFRRLIETLRTAKQLPSA